MPTWTNGTAQGLAWLTKPGPNWIVGTNGEARVWRYQEGAVGTIDKVNVYVSGITGSGIYALEWYTYPNGATIPIGPYQTTYVPGTDSGATVAGWVDEDGLTSNLYSHLNDSVTLPIPYLSCSTLYSHISRLVFHGTHATVTGNRILSVSVNADILYSFPAASGSSNAPLVVWADAGGILSNAIGIASAANYVGPVATWTLCPWTFRPWELADLNDLVSSSATKTFGLKFAAPRTFTPDGVTNFIRVYRLWLDVRYVPEDRTAWGYTTITSAESAGWKTFDIAPNVATSSSDAYLSVRRIYGNGSIIVPSVDKIDATVYTPVAIDGQRWMLDELGVRTEATVADGIAGLILTTTTPSTSAGSNPYAQVSAADVYSGHSVEQEFTATASGTFGLLRIVVRGQAPTFDGDLTVQVKRRSDNIDLGSAVVITEDMMAAPRSAWQIQTVNLANPAVLSANTQYYLSVTSTASDGTGWQVAYLDGASGGGSAGFGGIGNVLTVGGSDDTNSDLPFLLAVSPAAPTGFAASELGTAPLQSVRASWNATGLGSSFDAYELARSGDGAVWEQIADIRDETATDFDDYEYRFGSNWYRVRVRATNGAVSAWSQNVQVTVASAGGLTLTSNEDPSLNLAFADRGTVRGYEFGDQAEQVAVALQGRDDTAAFHPTERRGDRMAVELIVSKTGDDGRPTFDDLLALTRTPLSYVCVRDSVGGRWFSTLKIARGVWTARNLYTADVDITEITRTPSTPDAS